MVLLSVLLSSKETTRRSVANGLSPGVEEQSEYFDATENPLIKDKQRQEQDDEDSGVDNASQILRENSVSVKSIKKCYSNFERSLVAYLQFFKLFDL